VLPARFLTCFFERGRFGVLTPNAKRQTPNAKRQTPNAKRQNVETLKRHSFLKGQGTFADDNRLAADMRRHQAALIDLELDAHLSRPVHLPSLAPGEDR
jgi:hypothetical protein